MALYIGLSVWILILLMLSVRKGGQAVALAWPYPPQNSIQKHNQTVCKGLFFITFVILWFLTAFRSINIGNDTRVYLYYFKIFENGIDQTRTFEIGYQWLNVVINQFTHDPHAFLIIMASLMYLGIVIYIVKYSRNILFSLVLFFSCFFSIYMTMFRQGIAMIIVLFAYQFIKDKKIAKGTLLIGVAALFHSTAVVAFLLLLRNRLPLKKRYIMALVIVSVFVSQTGVLGSLINAILPRYSHYFLSAYAASGWLAVTYELIRALFFYMLICKVAETADNEGNRLLLTNFALMLIFCAFGFSMNLFTRAGEYFLLIGVVELPNALHLRELSNRRLWMFGIGFVLIIMFLIVLIYRPDWNHLYPYEFW